MPSTAGKLDIFNMALGFLGTRTIASENERTPEAIQCDLYWDRARRSALRDYPYRFAVRRVVLAEKTLPETYEGEWRHAYALPDQPCPTIDRHTRRARPPTQCPHPLRRHPPQACRHDR